MQSKADRRHPADWGGGGCDDASGLSLLAFGSQQIYYLADFTELGLLGLGINRKNGRKVWLLVLEGLRVVVLPPDECCDESE